MDVADACYLEDKNICNTMTSLCEYVSVQSSYFLLVLHLFSISAYLHSTYLLVDSGGTYSFLD